MRVLSLRNAALALVAGIGLSGCAYGPYGGVGVGYGNGYGYDPYYNGYGSYGYGSPYGYGASYGYSPYGWYDGYYYPGSGYYVYDRYQRPYRWSDSQRRHWEQRRNRSGEVVQNWRDFGATRPVNRVVIQQDSGEKTVITPRKSRNSHRVKVRVKRDDD